MKLGKECHYGMYLDHKIVQLNPKAPNKTTNCCGTAVSFAVKEEDVPKLIDFAVDFVRKGTYSEDTVMAVMIGLKVPEELAKWSCDAKSILYTVDDAVQVAERNGIRIINVTGKKGTIGAVAALGCFDMGLKAAGVPEDFE
jgi:tRNA(Ile2) C34 agmatinyltransferase TiaS